MTFAQPFSGYEILDRVGAGAMGTVFRARQKHMNREVALKVLRPSLARNEKYVERLRREARIVGALNHPNIVTGYDLGEEGGYHFFVMEFVEGQSLRSLLLEWGLFPEEKVLDVGIQVARALDHAFERGVIHRDIKPGNILIDGAGVVKLTDMGLAKGPTDMSLTRDGATVGTPQFISPEQAVDPQKADVRSDMYSLGASLFQMATGAAPFSGETIGQLIDQVLNEPAPLPSDLNAAISPGLSLVIKKLLAKDPDLRYQSPRELLEDLDRVQRDEQPGVDLRRLERAERSLERAERRGDAMRWVAGISVVAAVVVALVYLVERAVDSSGESFEPAEAAFERALLRDLQAFEDLRGRLEVCERYRRRAEGDVAEQRVVRERHEPLLAELRRRIGQHVDEAVADGPIDGWINEPANWRDPERYIRDVVAVHLPKAVGYRPESLPDQVRSSWEDGVSKVVEAVRSRMEVRDSNYRELFRRHLEVQLAGEIQRQLVADEFERARALLTKGSGAFHGVDGRPTLVQLGDALASDVRSRTNEFETAWRLRVDEQEALVADEMRADVKLEVAKVREGLQRGEDAKLLRLRLEEFRRRRLDDTYPPRPSFSIEGSPWDEIDRRIGQLVDDLDHRDRVSQADALNHQLTVAYRILVDSGVEDAFEFIHNVAIRTQLARAMQHARLFRGALEVRDIVFGLTLGPNNSERVVTVSRGKVRIVRRADGGYAMWDNKHKEREELLAFAIVAKSLLGNAASNAIHRKIGGDPAKRAGLALWKLVSGKTAEGLRLVKDNAEWREFVESDVLRIVNSTPVRTIGTGSGAVARVATELSRARKEKNLGEARYWLERFDQLPRELVERSHRAVRDDTARWVAKEERRANRFDELTRRSSSGARVRVTKDGTERIEYPAVALNALAMHGAWERHESSRTMTGEDLSIEEAWDRRLELPTLVANDRGLRADVDFSVSDTGSVTQVILFELLGVSVVLAVLPDGAVLADVVDRGALRDRDVLRRALGKLLAASVQASPDEMPHLIPGAHHRVVVDFNGRGKRTKLRVKVDEVLLREQRVGLGGQRDETFVVMPFQSIAVRSVEFVSSGVGG